MGLEMEAEKDTLQIAKFSKQAYVRPVFTFGYNLHKCSHQKLVYTLLLTANLKDFKPVLL